jgi:hypothetical protein
MTGTQTDHTNNNKTKQTSQGHSNKDEAAANIEAATIANNNAT